MNDGIFRFAGHRRFRADVEVNAVIWSRFKIIAMKTAADDRRRALEVIPALQSMAQLVFLPLRFSPSTGLSQRLQQQRVPILLNGTGSSTDFPSWSGAGRLRSNLQFAPPLPSQKAWIMGQSRFQRG